MKLKALTLDQLRRHSAQRTLFASDDIEDAIERLGFLQADPIRAPARAQDLILRQRVVGYRVGDLERAYPRCDLEEGFFINYGFLRRADYQSMQPRTPRRPWTAKTKRRAEELLAFVRERKVVHPREVDEHFAHGRVRNYWGGSSSATTHLLEAMHYRGWLRVVSRARGVRVYGLEQQLPAPDAATRRARLDRLIDLTVLAYAPLPALSLSGLLSRLRFAAPQWKRELPDALTRAKKRLVHERVDGVVWYWSADDQPSAAREPPPRVRLLAPFDPVVWDRRRFELLWGWPYRFEAYTPLAKRKLGYYALPLLWGERVIGWANTSLEDGALLVQLGFVETRPPSRRFERELEREIASVRAFLVPRTDIG